jgi:hypothetical protein
MPPPTAPDDILNIELTSWSGVEAFLDFRLQPGELFAATLLMRNCCDDCGFAAAIRTLAYLRGHEFLESGRQFYCSGWHCGTSTGDARASSNSKIDTVAKT